MGLAISDNVVVSIDMCIVDLDVALWGRLGKEELAFVYLGRIGCRPGISNGGCGGDDRGKEGEGEDHLEVKEDMRTKKRGKVFAEEARRRAVKFYTGGRAER